MGAIARGSRQILQICAGASGQNKDGGLVGWTLEEVGQRLQGVEDGVFDLGAFEIRKITEKKPKKILTPNLTKLGSKELKIALISSK